MEWIKTTEKLPERIKGVKYSQVACLCWYRGQAEILMFNHEHLCWDDESGDDHECDIGEVSHWMLLPERPES